MSTTAATDSMGTANESASVQQFGHKDLLRLLAAATPSQEQTIATLSDPAQSRSAQQLFQATALIGQTVEVEAADGSPMMGIVSTVRVVAGSPKLIIGEDSYDLNQVHTVSPPES